MLFFIGGNMTLEEYYKIAITKEQKTVTDLLVIEVYKLINKKGDNK